MLTIEQFSRWNRKTHWKFLAAQLVYILFDCVKWWNSHFSNVLVLHDNSTLLSAEWIARRWWIIKNHMWIIIFECVRKSRLKVEYFQVHEQRTWSINFVEFWNNSKQSKFSISSKFLFSMFLFYMFLRKFSFLYKFVFV